MGRQKSHCDFGRPLNFQANFAEEAVAWMVRPYLRVNSCMSVGLIAAKCDFIQSASLDVFFVELNFLLSARSFFKNFISATKSVTDGHGHL